MICPHCGSENPPHGRFCLGCGQPVATQGATIITPLPQHPGAPQAAWQPAAAEERRPVWPLILVVVLLLLGVGTFAVLRARSLASVAPKSVGGEFQVATPKAAEPRPFTPARPAEPIRSPAPVQAPAPPPQAQMPPEVYAYLAWLSQKDIDRKQMEDAAQAELPGLMAGMLTGGMGMDADVNEQDPTAKYAQSFKVWNQRLVGLLRSFVALQGLDRAWAQYRAPGPPQVPQQCALLHGLYRQAIELQADSAREIAAAMISKDMNRITKQMASSKRAQGNLQRAEAELGRVCATYRVPQWFHIEATPGDTPLPPMMPR